MAEGGSSAERQIWEAKSVQVVELSKDAAAPPTLLSDVIEKIIVDGEVQQMPVFVVSITGEPRSGQSFLLNLMVTYLQYIAEYSTALDWESSDLDIKGGRWMTGEDTVTTGIWIWDKPFIIESASGKVAVLLIDCQGLGNLVHGDSGVDILLQYITLQLANVFIINGRPFSSAKGIPQEPTLYAAALSDNSLGPPRPLIILRRDWESDSTYGERPDLLAETFGHTEISEDAGLKHEGLEASRSGGLEASRSGGLEASQSGEGRTRTYEQATVFTLPRPGKLASHFSDDKSIRVWEVDRPFVVAARHVFEKILQQLPADLDRLPTGSDFLAEFQMLPKRMAVDRQLYINTQSHALEEMIMYKAFKDARNIYTADMQMKLDSGTFSNSKEVERQSYDIMMKACDSFSTNKLIQRYGTSDIRRKYRELLQSGLLVQNILKRYVYERIAHDIKVKGEADLSLSDKKERTRFADIGAELAKLGQEIEEKYSKEMAELRRLGDEIDDDRLKRLQLQPKARHTTIFQSMGKIFKLPFLWSKEASDSLLHHLRKAMSELSDTVEKITEENPSILGDVEGIAKEKPTFDSSETEVVDLGDTMEKMTIESETHSKGNSSPLEDAEGIAEEDPIFDFLEPEAVDSDYEPVPTELADMIFRLCEQSKVDFALYVQCPHDWRKVTVLGVNAESAKSDMDLEMKAFPQFTVQLQNKKTDGPLYTQRMAWERELTVEQKLMVFVDNTWVVSTWTTCELMVIADERNRDSATDGTVCVVVPAHLILTEQQCETAASCDADIDHVREDVESKTTKRRYVIQARDREHAIDLKHPPLMGYRHWFKPLAEGETCNCSRVLTLRPIALCPCTFMNDIALLYIERVQAETLKETLRNRLGINAFEPPEVVPISMREHLDILVRRKQRIVVGAAEGFLAPSPNGGGAGNRLYGLHLAFVITSGHTMEAGDCGTIVYLQARDQQKKPVGMFIGRFTEEIQGYGTIYQAVILHQALKAIEVGYPHQVRNIRVF